MIEINTAKRFKYIWFVLFYITFLFITIIYSYQIFPSIEFDEASWQDVASYDFDLVDQTYGDGVLTNTYGISTPEQLAGMFMIDESTERNLNNSSLVYADTMDNIGESDEVITINSEYILLNDVNMSGRSWTPSDFKYIFNGNYHVISNLSFSESFQYLGMVTTLTGTIKNLTLKSVVITNNYSSSTESGTGAIAGKNQGTISNVLVTGGKIQGPSYASNCYRMVGGITGSNYNGEIFNCINYANVDRAKFAGGIAGNSYGGSIKNCVNYGTIQCGRNNQARAGGIVGREGASETGQSMTTLKLCVNYGNVSMGTTGSNISNYTIATEVIVGGIVGTAYDTIDQCANYGIVSCGSFNLAGSNLYHDKVYAGGIVGYAKSNITNCYNIGYVLAEAKKSTTNDEFSYKDFSDLMIHEYKFDKILWWYDSHEELTYSRKTAKDYSEESKAYAGGIAAYCVNNSKIENCYNTGTVSGSYSCIEFKITDYYYYYFDYKGADNNIVNTNCITFIKIYKNVFFQPICSTGNVIDCYYLTDAETSYELYTGLVDIEYRPLIDLNKYNTTLERASYVWRDTNNNVIKGNSGELAFISDGLNDLAGKTYKFSSIFYGRDTGSNIIKGKQPGCIQEVQISKNGNKYSINCKTKTNSGCQGKNNNESQLNNSTALTYELSYDSGVVLPSGVNGTIVNDVNQLNRVFQNDSYFKTSVNNNSYPYLKNLYW